jgi:hypothetical protein
MAYGLVSVVEVKLRYCLCFRHSHGGTGCEGPLVALCKAEIFTGFS